MPTEMPFWQRLGKMRPAQSTTDFDKNVKSTKAHYIGVDIGTASARACVINEDGELVAAATERTHTWRPQAGSFVCTICSFDA